MPSPRALTIARCVVGSDGRDAETLAPWGQQGWLSQGHKLHVPRGGRLLMMQCGTVWFPSTPKAVCELILNGSPLLSGLSVVAAWLALGRRKINISYSYYADLNTKYVFIPSS